MNVQPEATDVDEPTGRGDGSHKFSIRPTTG